MKTKLLLFSLFIMFAVLVIPLKKANATIIIRYNYAQFKTIAKAIAKNADIKLKFINSTVPKYYISNFSSCTKNFPNANRTPQENQIYHKFACTPYAYTSWYGKVMGNYNVSSNPPKLTKKRYKHILYRFLSKKGDMGITANGNIYYAFSLNSHAVRRMIAPNGWNKQYGFLPDKTKYWTKIRKTGYFFDGIVKAPYSLMYSLFTNNTKAVAISLTERQNIYYKKIYPDSLKMLRNMSNIQKTVYNVAGDSFALSKTGLRKLYFNVVNPEYYNAAASAAGQISNMGMMSMSNPGGMIQTINNAELSVYRGIKTSINKMLSNTNSKTVLYNTVGNYYANGLISKYGALETSFLKMVGIGIYLNISYTTILRNTNIFLSKIQENKTELSRFNKLFGHNFRNISDHNNYIPNVAKLNSSASILLTGLKGPEGDANSNFTGDWNAGGALANLNNTDKAYFVLRHWATYPSITLKSINFFSVSYYLIGGALSGNKLDAKILRNIIMSHYDKALSSFNDIKVKVNPYSRNNYVAKFLNTDNISTQKKIMQKVKIKTALFTGNSYIQRGSPSYEMTKERYGAAKWAYLKRVAVAYYLMQILILHKEIKANNSPWSHFSIKADKSKIIKLWHIADKKYYEYKQDAEYAKQQLIVKNSIPANAELGYKIVTIQGNGLRQKGVCTVDVASNSNSGFNVYKAFNGKDLTVNCYPHITATRKQKRDVTAYLSFCYNKIKHSKHKLFQNSKYFNFCAYNGGKLIN